MRDAWELLNVSDEILSSSKLRTNTDHGFGNPSVIGGVAALRR